MDHLDTHYPSNETAFETVVTPVGVAELQLASLTDLKGQNVIIVTLQRTDGTIQRVMMLPSEVIKIRDYVDAAIAQYPDRML